MLLSFSKPLTLPQPIVKRVPGPKYFARFLPKTAIKSFERCHLKNGPVIGQWGGFGQFEVEGITPHHTSQGQRHIQRETNICSILSDIQCLSYLVKMDNLGFNDIIGKFYFPRGGLDSFDFVFIICSGKKKLPQRTFLSRSVFIMGI